MADWRPEWADADPETRKRIHAFNTFRSAVLAYFKGINSELAHIQSALEGVEHSGDYEVCATLYQAFLIDAIDEAKRLYLDLPNHYPTVSTEREREEQTVISYPEMGAARREVFKSVFPWVIARIKEIAGLHPEADVGPGTSPSDNENFIRVHREYETGSRSENELVVALCQRQNQAWEKLTGLNPLGLAEDWRAAGIAAKAPNRFLEPLDISNLAKFIKPWAMALYAAKRPEGTKTTQLASVEAELASLIASVEDESIRFATLIDRGFNSAIAILFGDSTVIDFVRNALYVSSVSLRCSRIVANCELWESWPKSEERVVFGEYHRTGWSALQVASHFIDGMYAELASARLKAFPNQLIDEYAIYELATWQDEFRRQLAVDRTELAEWPKNRLHQDRSLFCDKLRKELYAYTQSDRQKYPGYDDFSLEQRDKWIYEKRKAKKRNPQIIEELGRIFAEKSWEPITTNQAIRDAVNRYIRNTGAPALPNSKGGRPKRKTTN